MEHLPYVTAALICERVLQEKDGTLSAVRIVDRVEVHVVTNAPNVDLKNIAPAIQLTGLICIKSGLAKGKGLLTIDGEGPTGKTKRLAELPLELHGADHGQNFVVNMTIVTQEDGLHWFDVRVDGQTLTRIPLILVRKQEQVEMAEKTSEPQKTG